MNDSLKVSGRRFGLPDPSGEWKFETRPGGWIIATGPSGQRVRLCALELRGKLSFSVIGMQPAMGEIVSRSSHGAGGALGASDADLTAQFPGKVRKLLVQAGARVAAGDPLVLVEAMKMEFAIKAPGNGTVTQVRVKEGQQLSPGDRLVDFEPEGEKHGGR